MSLEMMASGNLSIDPLERQERGNSFMAFTLACNVLNDTGDREAVWIDAMVPGHLMARAVRLRKGDGVWVRAHVTIRRYENRGQQREAWQMHVNELITSREVHTS